MEIFQTQLLIFKYCGIERFSTPRMKNLFIALKIFNILALIYNVFGAVLFSCTTKDIREIAESMTPGFTGFLLIIKYVIFCIRAEEIFEIMDEIGKLNVECKEFY